MIDRILNMKFKNKSGSSFSFAIKDVKSEIVDSDISEAMDAIIEKDLFTVKGGKLDSKVEANIVTKETETVIL